VQRVIHTIALAAALLAVLTALWGDQGPWFGLKRAVISYVVFYFVGGALALIFRAGVLAEDSQQRTARSIAGETAPSSGARAGGAAERAPAGQPGQTT
jgi:hypothetical protein